MQHIPLTLSALLILSLPLSGGAGWQDLLDELPTRTESSGATSSGTGLSALSSSEMTSGLKQALDTAMDIAVKQLGQDGGFLNDPTVRIGMPDSLEWVEKGLRMTGQSARADEFVGTLNHAAEQAVPLALEHFRAAIKNLTVRDAQAILTGPKDAATQYFRNQSESQLRAQFMPIVSDTTSKAGVTSAYKNLLNNAGPAAGLMNSSSLNLDEYVTGKALDGLFLKVAEQEALIRTHPVARSTDLLKKVFGAVSH